ncbi:MAG: DUF3341 domain-containing protein [Silvanigrellales bacterium]|nr:DUF3341 domain-containing protein [Silvanigrellales bacterium]
MTTKSPYFGALAEFDSAAAIFHACEKVRDKGFRKWDAHTPFPVHGLDRAMGLGSSKVPWIVLVLALLGGTGGFALQAWTSTEGYAMVISNKPLLSWQAFMPVTFELSVLLGAFGAVFGMWGVNRLPQWYHSVFRSQRFAKVTDDKFFISIESADPKFNPEATQAFLREIGATHVELLEH